MEVKRQKKDHANTNQKKAVVKAMLISDRLDIKAESIAKGKERHFHSAKMVLSVERHNNPKQPSLVVWFADHTCVVFGSFLFTSVVIFHC